MAINYDNLFANLGSVYKQYLAYGAYGDAVEAARQDILDQYQGNDADRPIEGFYQAMESIKASYTGHRATLANYLSRTFYDRDNLLELGVVDGNAATALSRFLDAFEDAPETVNASVAAIGSVTAGGGNAGNATVLKTLLLDGVTSPGSVSGITYPAQLNYRGKTSELAVPEDHRIECTADSYGSTGASESFSWTGGLSVAAHSTDDEGSGSNPTLEPVHKSSRDKLSTQGRFETFSSNTPTGWTVTDGTAGTHVFEHSSAVYRGSKCLRLTGTGAQAVIKIQRSFSSGQLLKNRMYVCAGYIKASSVPTNGALTIQCEGTGYTAGGTEKVSIAAGSLPTSWTLVHFFVLMPANLPTDMKLTIGWSGTPDNTVSLDFDHFAFGEVTYGAGFGLAIAEGSTASQVGDIYTFSTTNTEGKLQQMMRRVFGVQVASNNAGAETQLDSLAE